MYTHTHIYIYVYIHMYICMHACIHTYIHTHIPLVLVIVSSPYPGPPIKNLDFKGFDASRLLNLKDGNVHVR